MIEAVLVYVLTAVSFTIGKAIYGYGEPHFFLGVRFLITSIVLLGVYRIEKWQHKKVIEPGHYRLFLFYIIIFYFSFIFELLALSDMSSSKAAFLYNLSPFLSALFSYYYFNERITLKKISGLCIGLVGFIPTLIDENSGEGITVAGFLSRSEIFMFIAVFTTVYGWGLVRMLVKQGYSPLVINGIGMLGSGLISLGVSAFCETWTPLPIMHYKPFIILTFLVILLNDIGFYTIYSFLLKRYTTTFLALAGMATPLITAGLGWLFLHEPISLSFIFSLVVVLLGLSIVYSEELRQGYIVNKSASNQKKG